MHASARSASAPQRRTPRLAAATKPGQRAAFAAAGLAAALTLPAGAAALTPVTQRSVLDVPRIDRLETAALPDGRVLLGWVNGNNSGDTTLAMVRPAGGVLPPTYQTLRTGYASESVDFLTGGPADDPVITYFQDGDSRSPFTAKLSGNLFGTQSGVLSAIYSTGRFPTYARCPDGSTVFGYQYTIPGTPQTYSAFALKADASGKPGGSGSTSLANAPDAFQDPTVSCDQGIPLFSSERDPDGDAVTLGEQLRVHRLGVGGGLQLARDVADGVSASAPEARVAPDGRLWLVWTEYSGGVSTSYFRTRAPGWSGASGFTTGTSLGPDYTGDLFFDAAGNTHVLVQHSTGLGSASWGIRTAAPGQDTFGPEQELLPSSGKNVQLLTGHPDGNPRLLLASSSPPDFLRSYEVRGIPQAGSGSTLTPITGFSHLLGDAAPAFLPSGDLFIAGAHQVEPGRIELRESGLDTGAPPVLSNVVVPGLAAPGDPLPLQIDATDPLGLASFSWTVDGQTLTEQDTSFTFATPGTRTVTARAVDRAGNATELTRTVRVLDPAAVTPGSPEFAAAVAAAGGTLAPRDGAAPTLTKSSATRGRKGKAKTRATVSITPNEAVSADLELVGTLKRGSQRGQLVLTSTRISAAPAGLAAKRNLTIPASLARLVGGKLSVRITLTDLAGNRTVKTLRVKTAKK